MSAHRLRALPAEVLQRLSSDIGGVCERLVALHERFPGQDVVRLVNATCALRTCIYHS